MDPSLRELRVQTVCLLVIAGGIVAVAMYWLRPVLIPFVLALFFTYCLTPIVDVQTRWLRFPRPLALATTLLFGAGALALVSAYLTRSVAQLAQSGDLYQAQFNALRIRAVAALAQLGVDEPLVSPTLLMDARVGSMLSTVLDALLGLLKDGVMVVIFMFFMLLGARGTKHRGLLGEIEESIKSYIFQKVLIAGGTGAAHAGLLWALGVPFAPVFGLLAFILNFIPNLGPIATAVLHLPAVFLIPQLSTTTLTLAIALPLVVQLLSGIVLEPKIMGDSLDLHPVVVILALVFFGMIWGVAGMFLATPIAAVLKILFSRMELTRPAAEAMAGRLSMMSPSVTPMPFSMPTRPTPEPPGNAKPMLGREIPTVPDRPRASTDTPSPAPRTQPSVAPPAPTDLTPSPPTVRGRDL